MLHLSKALCAALALFFVATPALAAPAATANSGDTAWILTSTALVLFMTLPGLALFYGGLVRARNFLSVFVHCFIITCVASISWAAFGYELAFGADIHGLIGTVESSWLMGLGDRVRDGLTIPENLFALYQMSFAIITPALVVGAFPERVNFPYVLLFALLWPLLVYVPVAHWLWGNGWLATWGARDFAGGIVVHTTAGISSLVAAIMIGKRKGFPTTLALPHSPAMTMIGAGMLWVGWFGFNGGSALVAGAPAAQAMIATHLAACAGALLWSVLEWRKIRKATSIGIATGAIAGLATVTPAAGYISAGGGVLLGLAGSFCCFGAVHLVKSKWKLDDSLDVFAVHGVGGMLGALLVAIVAHPALGGSGLGTGLNLGGQLEMQALAILVVALWSAVMTWCITRLGKILSPLRVDEESEYDGLDIATHGERAYELG